jgi:putative endonuclease
MVEKYYVYLLSSKSRVLYTGITNDLGRRVHEHKIAEADGFTKRYCVNRLVYYETFKYVGNAIRREKEIKGWLRDRKIALIEANNPTWEDLSEKWARPFQYDKKQVLRFAQDDKQRG